MRKFLLCISLFIIIWHTNAQTVETDTSKKQSSLPSVSVKDINGQQINFAEYVKSGQITILSFWATWCKPCMLELNNIDNVYEEWQKKYGLRLIAVSLDDSRTVHKVKPLVISKSWTFDVLIDGNSELQRALNVTNPPTTILIDKKGAIVYTHTGYLEGDETELEKKIIELIEN